MRDTPLFFGPASLMGRNITFKIFNKPHITYQMSMPRDYAPISHKKVIVHLSSTDTQFTVPLPVYPSWFAPPPRFRLSPGTPKAP